jgi:hypothetical protein
VDGAQRADDVVAVVAEQMTGAAEDRASVGRDPIVARAARAKLSPAMLMVRGVVTVFAQERSVPVEEVVAEVAVDEVEAADAVDSVVALAAEQGCRFPPPAAMLSSPLLPWANSGAASRGS